MKVRIKQGTSGYVVNLWKKYFNGENENRVLISKDTYNLTPTILYMGEKIEERQDVNDLIIDNELQQMKEKIKKQTFKVCFFIKITLYIIVLFNY